MSKYMLHLPKFSYGQILVKNYSSCIPCKCFSAQKFSNFPTVENNGNIGQYVVSGKSIHESPLLRKFSTSGCSNKDWVTVTYQKTDGENIAVKGKEGDSLLDVVVNNNVDLDGFGACEGTLSCSTCHLIFEKSDFDKITDPLSDEELDMLDLAFGLTDTSRLGCQVCLSKSLEGVVVKVPAEKADARNA